MAYAGRQRPVSEYFDRQVTNITSGRQVCAARSYSDLGRGHKGRRSMFLATSAATSNDDQPALLGLLLQNGASVYEWDIEGNTGLHLAVMMALPDQPWVVQTLTTLIRAGADPTQPNHAGSTAYDFACTTALEFGSFRRDLLLQALIETASDVQDHRLFAPPRFTAFYTRDQHDTIRRQFSPDMLFQLREALLDRLADISNQRGITSSRKLHEAAVDRILPCSPSQSYDDSHTILEDALSYLERMSEAKKQLIRIVKDRLPNQSWVKFGKTLNWLKMTDQAQTAALVAFDWVRPVDFEDVFLTYVDNLIEQLEDLAPYAPNSENIERLIDVLEHAVPSYTSSTAQRVNCEECSFSSTSIVEVETEELARKVSIIQTPMEYYGRGFSVSRDSTSSSESVCEEVDIVIKPLAIANKHKRWLWGSKK